MLQRETVNDAWDLPKAETMTRFFSDYPEYVDYAPVSSSFEWPWYYAFQNNGDTAAKGVSEAYREGRLERERFASWLSFVSPPAKLQRAMQSLAKTDKYATIAYEDRVREFHEKLRAFYYPKFFDHHAYDQAQAQELPVFSGD